MEKVDNQKVLDHIDGAKDWLDKAKAEYDSANPVGGELILNLAGAEIKYARELSCSRYVVTEKRIPKRAGSGDFRKTALPIAASVILLLGVVFWLQTGGWNTSKNLSALQKSAAPVSNEPKTVVKNNSGNTTEKVSAVNEQPDNLQSENETILEKSVSESWKTSSERERTVSNSGNTAIANQNRVADKTATQPKLQPVSQLSIDEEALTKEASHSLRNGK